MVFATRGVGRRGAGSVGQGGGGEGMGGVEGGAVGRRGWERRWGVGAEESGLWAAEKEVGGGRAGAPGGVGGGGKLGGPRSGGGG